MPISRRVDSEERTVYVTVTGPMVPAEITACAHAVQDDDSIGPAMRWLVDCRATTIVLSSPEIRRFALEYAKQGVDPARRIAVVVSSDVALGLARMFAGYACLSAEAFTVVRNLAEAREWLRLRPVGVSSGDG